MPLARNAQAFLAGRDSDLEFDHRPVQELTAMVRDRWVIPRAKRKPEYRQFRREQLWDKIAG